MLKQLVLILFSTAHFSLALVTENEPNDTFAQANPVQCGDTVFCARLATVTDADNFRFSAIAGDSLYLTTFACSGLTNTFLVLYDQHDSVLAVNDNDGPNDFSSIRWAVTETAEYIARVICGGAAPDSTYSLHINCPHPAPEDYDLCETARTIPALPYYDEGSTSGATNQFGTLAPDVFYRFDNPITRSLHVIVCSDLFDARVQMLGYCIGGEGDDESQGCNLGADLFTFNLPPGPHTIMVEGTAANQIGDFSLEITAQPTECPTPFPVVIARVGGYPFLDWPQLEGPSYYIVWQSSTMNSEYEHLGTTVFTYFTDSTGFVTPRRFYYVTAVCPW